MNTILNLKLDPPGKNVWRTEIQRALKNSPQTQEGVWLHGFHHFSRQFAPRVSSVQITQPLLQHCVHRCKLQHTNRKCFVCSVSPQKNSCCSRGKQHACIAEQEERQKLGAHGSADCHVLLRLEQQKDF